MKWRLLKYRIFSAFENMAIDEAIFRETIAKQKPPTLRFFGWHPSAVSIGYFQNVDEEINVERCRAAGVDVVRRMTGGKAVYHRDEVTYSLTASGAEKIFPDDIILTYELISRGLARGLSMLGISADPAGVDGAALKKKTKLSSTCFWAPSARELLVGGKKICGSAQVRRSDAFLQHGSMLMTFDASATAALTLPSSSETLCRRLRDSVTAINEQLARPGSAEDISDALQKGLSEQLEVEFSEGGLTSSERHLADELLQKYTSEAWNFARKKDTFRVARERAF
jgi:lipoate-protein ligase A